MVYVLLAPNNHECGGLCEWCVAVRRAEKPRYVPSERELPPVRQPKPVKPRERAECPVCHESTPLRNDGNFYPHGGERIPGSYYCPGLRPLPKVII